jgi:hypothetical protein
MKREHKTTNIFIRDVYYIVPKINFLYGLQQCYIAIIVISICTLESNVLNSIGVWEQLFHLIFHTFT